MTKRMKERAKRCGQLIKQLYKQGSPDATCRGVAKIVGCSKSTVHKDLTERLPEFSPGLAKTARKILNINDAEKAHRGGAATKALYENRIH